MNGLHFTLAIALLFASQAPPRAPSRVPAQPQAGTRPDPPGRAVVIFPFENTSEDRSLYWLGEAIADGLIREIRRAGGDAVERVERLSVVEELGVPALSTLTLAAQIRAAEQLGAAALVTGSFGARDGALNLRARIVDATAGRTGPWITASGSLKEIYDLQRALFQALRADLPPRVRVSAAAGAEAGSPEDGAPQAAYEFLMKSLFEDAPSKRETLLRRAVDIAPGYLRAQVELARLYRDAGKAEKAVPVLSRIVTRDRELAAEAENLLAELELARDRPLAAESALKRSLQSHETARAHLLLAKIAIARSDRELAKTELSRARTLDPDDPELAEVEEALNAHPQ